MSIGTRKGDIRDGPLSRMTSTCSMSVSMPPTPVAIDTPMRSRSSPPPLMPPSSIACVAAATANCAKRSVRRTSLRSRYLPASKSLTSPAICVS